MKASVLNTHMGNISIDNEVIAQYAGAVMVQFGLLADVIAKNYRLLINYYMKKTQLRFIINWFNNLLQRFM